jgi:predicted nucleic acid-binding protein
VRGIADTGVLVAFANRTDRHHAWALGVAEQITAPLLTCEAVLAEAAFHLENVAFVLSLVREGLVIPAFDVNAHLVRLADLAARYAHRKPDLADLCLIRLSELHPRHTVITVDREDFRVYRRNKRETIPITCPPERCRSRVPRATVTTPVTARGRG